MAPKRKNIPFEDSNIVILGLRTLRDNGFTQDEIAAYYTEKYQVKYSRRTVGRWLEKLKENEDNAR